MSHPAPGYNPARALPGKFLGAKILMFSGVKKRRSGRGAAPLGGLFKRHWRPAVSLPRRIFLLDDNSGHGL